MIYVGIDYSMTSPAICLYNDKIGEFIFNNCVLHYMTQLKKYDVSFKNVSGHYFEYKNEMERYDIISSFFIDRILELHEETKIFIEDYSMGSKGRVFNIAENTGVLKYKFWNFQITFKTVSPAIIKKFATGKGNSNKEKMQLVFEQESSIRLKEELKMTEKQWNPSSDLIDAYYICKYGYQNEKNE
jgi:Holliday junction resolvasome RuvABC endonuclease subunit